MQFRNAAAHVRSLDFLGFLAIVLLGTAGCAPQITPDLPVLPEIQSNAGVVTVTLTALLDAERRPELRWNDAAVAPVLRVDPGDHIRIHLINHLPRICGLGMVSNLNLHFHGLTTSPKAPGDDVLTRRARPNAAIDYDVLVSPGQPPGLYWYHAHAHGLTTWEVGNGMAGAIIVNGIARDVPEVAGLRERVVILGDRPTSPELQPIAREISEIPIDVPPTPDAEGRVPLYVKPAHDTDASGPCSAEPGMTPTINGLPNVRIGIRPGEREFFRVVNASAHRHYILDAGSDMRFISQDGVPLVDYPGGHALTQSQIEIPPAGRAEFIVTDRGVPMRLHSSCFAAGRAGDANPPVDFATFYDDTHATDASVARVESVPPMRVASFYRTPMPAPTQHRDIHLQEDRGGFKINGHRYYPDAAPTITVHSGTVEEWTVENDTDENHVFHLHQVHFVLESTNNYPNADRRWLDVVDIPAQGRGARFGDITPSRVKLLVDFRDPVIRGVFLLHCHILEHEDGGMATKIRVE